MPFVLAPWVWGLLGFTAGTAGAGAAFKYFDQPETVYNFPENADPAMIEAIKGTLPQHSGTVGQGLSDIGSGLQYVAIAAAVIYFLNKKKGT